MATNFTQMTQISGKDVYIPPSWPHIVFGLFLFGESMSIPCYFFMMYHLLATSVARKVLHNHAIIIMLIFNFISLTIDLSMTLHYLRVGAMLPLIPAFCLIQQFVDFGIWYGALFLMLWTSMERHILIFHSALVATARGRLLFHYIPLALFSLYAPIWYFYLIFLYPCDHIYDPTESMCGGPYFYETIPGWYYWYESLVNYTIPILLIIVFSIGLIVRVIVQKRRLQQGVEWRRHRKMITQLIAISTVYLVFDLPFVIIVIVQWSGIPDFGRDFQVPYISYLTYVPAIILPYATLVTLPEPKKKLGALIRWKANQRVIAPLTRIT